MPCLDLPTLAALAEGASPSAGQAAHLDVCAACQAEVVSLHEALGLAPLPEDPGVRKAWRELAAGTLSSRASQQPIFRRLAWAAGLLLVAGIFFLVRSASSPGDAGNPPEAAAASRPAWMAVEGEVWEAGSEPAPLVLAACLRGAAAAGTRLRMAEDVLELQRGAVWMDLPPGLEVTLQAPEGGSLRISGGAFWAAVAPAARTQETLLLSSAFADEPSSFRICLLSARAETLPPQAWVQWREGRWVVLEGPRPEAEVAALRTTADGLFSAQDWTVLTRAKPLQSGGWRLGPGGPALLGSRTFPRSGVLRLTLNRPPDAAEVLLAFPQPGGGRAWRLGNWSRRHFPGTATLSLAFGPWGAEGYLNGMRLWSLTARELASSFPSSPEGLEVGAAVSGGAVEILEAELLGEPAP